MKHLKKFEKNYTNFKVGDYVKCVRISDTNFNHHDIYIISHIDEEFVKVKKVKDKENSITYYIADRFKLAKPKEIEEYNLKQDINKYNL